MNLARWTYQVILVLTICDHVLAKPAKIVSLNLCADQLVVLLADRDRIASLTYLSREPTTSYVWRQAKNLPINYGRAEEVLLVKPDLIISGRFTTRPTVAYLKKRGFNMIELDLVNDLHALRAQIRLIAKAFGELERGENLIREMDRRIEAVQLTRSEQRLLAAIYLPFSTTAGQGTLIHKVIQLAGYENLAERLSLSGFTHLPLETVVLNQPDLLIFDMPDDKFPTLTNEFTNHRAIKLSATAWQIITMPSRYWTCGGPHVAEAVEHLVYEQQ